MEIFYRCPVCKELVKQEQYKKHFGDCAEKIIAQVNILGEDLKLCNYKLVMMHSESNQEDYLMLEDIEKKPKKTNQKTY